MSTLPKTFVTPEEYLERERKSEERHEYYNGEIFPMPGVSRTHDRIEVRLTVLIAQHLKGTNFEVSNASLRVLVKPTGLYTYPDLSVVRGESQFADAHIDTLINPTLLVEILSPSTEDYDLGKKAKMYRGIPSLEELLLIAQDSHSVDLHRRQADGSWVIHEANGLEASIELASIGYTLHLRELYP